MNCNCCKIRKNCEFYKYNGNICENFEYTKNLKFSNCVVCNKEFKQLTKVHICCSKKCRIIYDRKRYYYYVKKIGKCPICGENTGNSRDKMCDKCLIIEYYRSKNINVLNKLRGRDITNYDILSELINNNIIPDELYYTPIVGAKKLNMTPENLIRKIKRFNINIVKIGKNYFISESELKKLNEISRC